MNKEVESLPNFSPEATTNSGKLSALKKFLVAAALVTGCTPAENSENSELETDQIEPTPLIVIEPEEGFQDEKLAQAEDFRHIMGEIIDDYMNELEPSLSESSEQHTDADGYTRYIFNASATEDIFYSLEVEQNAAGENTSLGLVVVQSGEVANNDVAVYRINNQGVSIQKGNFRGEDLQFNETAHIYVNEEGQIIEQITFEDEEQGELAVLGGSTSSRRISLMQLNDALGDFNASFAGGFIAVNKAAATETA